NALAARDQCVEVGGTGMGLRAAMEAKQVGEARMPARIGAARETQRLLVARRHDDEAAEPQSGERRAGPQRIPDRLIAFRAGARLGRWVEAHRIEAPARRACGALRGVDAVPDRWMGLLQRRDLHWHIAKTEMLAGKIHALARQPLQQEFQALGIDLLRA